MKNLIFLRRKDHTISCSPRQTFEMGILQLEKVAFEGVTESKQICIICKIQGRNTRRGGVDSFMQFRDVKQEKNFFFYLILTLRVAFQPCRSSS